MTSASILDLLRRYESRNITFMDPEHSWPIVWERAKGVYVWDVEGRRYLDLTAAFGVAAAGHANPRVVQAGQRQMARLVHAMGDVHPHAQKARLARELSRITFERWASDSGSKGRTSHRNPTTRGKTIFCNSGFEAVEAALKTAALVTGRRGVVAFQGAYHGVGYGALNVTHRDHFRARFRSQLGEFGRFLPFPRCANDLQPLEKPLATMLEDCGAVMVEPIQVRGGVNIPPLAFLPWLRRMCDQGGALLVLDEIYTGFGRTGRWFACEHSGTIPDLICLGKALTGGFPLSACVGRADVMDAAWPASMGEAIHTSTFLGHPVGCAMSLAQIAEVERRKLPRHSAHVGESLIKELEALRSKTFQLSVRGLGLTAGLEVRQQDDQPATAVCLRLIHRMLKAGFILLPEGEFGNVLSFTPPLTITLKQIAKSVGQLKEFLELEDRSVSL